MSQAELAPFDERCKVLFIGVPPRTRKELTPLISRNIPLASMVDFAVVPSQQDLRAILQAREPIFCFVEIPKSGENVLHLISELLRMSPALSIVALLPANQPDLILRSLRMGATDFLIPPFNADQVGPVLQKLVRQARQGEKLSSRGRVYCLLPVKGACGATTIACTLAYQWRKNAAKRVLLADLDPLTGVVAFLLKAQSQFSFADVLQRAADMDADLWKAMTTKRAGVDLLLAPEWPPTDLELNDASSILDFARAQYQVVIADAGSAYGEWTLSITACSDEVLVVTTNEVSSVQAAQRVIGYLESKGVPREKLRLIVNRYNQEVGLREEVIQSVLGLEVVQVIPGDYDALQQVLLHNKSVSPSSRFGKAVAELALKLEGPEPVTPRTTSIAGLKSLFSRLSF